MAKSGIKIRGLLKNGLAQVRCLIAHPMETGQRTDKATGKLIPAHFIQEVTCELNGNVILLANWGPSVSKNPTLFFDIKEAKAGDTLKISWRDNKNESGTFEGKITVKQKCRRDDNGEVIADSCKPDTKGKFTVE